MWEVSRGGESSFKLNSSAKCPQFLTWLEIERSSCKCKLKHRLDKTWSRTRLSMSVLGQFCSDRDRRHNLGHVSDGSWVFQGQNFRDELYFVSFTIWGMQQRELEPSLLAFDRILFTLLDLVSRAWMTQQKQIQKTAVRPSFFSWFRVSVSLCRIISASCWIFNTFI